MSDDKNVQSNESNAADGANEKPVVNRTPEEYAKRIAEVSDEAKEYRKKNAELKAKLEEIEKKSLEEKGQYKDLYEKATAQAKEKDLELEKLSASFAYRSVSNQVSLAAAKEGCVDVNALIQLSDLKTLEVNKETFDVSEDSIKILLENAKKTKPYLFKTKEPALNHGNPSVTPVVTDKPQTVDDLVKQFVMLK